MARTGRPTKYTKELLEKAKAYANDFTIDGEDDVIPSIEGLCLYCGIHKTTAFDWAHDERKREFSYCLDLVLAKQAKLLMNKSLSGEFNHSTARLMLSTHGYRETTQVDQISSDGSNRPVEIKVVGASSTQKEREPLLIDHPATA